MGRDQATAINPSSTESPIACDYNDWSKLKAVFAQAYQAYEIDDASQCLCLLRDVLRECHRFLTSYQDPSVLFGYQPHGWPDTHSPDALTPSEEVFPREYDWYDLHREVIRPKKSRSPSRQRHTELPTAFHAMLGTALFYFGNLVAQDPSLAEPGEPDKAHIYWLAALDVFGTAESLPGRTNPSMYVNGEDWRMAIIWGRTLVALADEMLTLRKSHPSAVAGILTDEPKWPPDSIFTAIASRRPPMTGRMSLGIATADELLVLAADHFSRGIFRMPHPSHLPHRHQHHRPDSPAPVHPRSSWSTPHTPNCAHTLQPTHTPPLPPAATLTPEPAFSRAKELFTIASEVFCVAERLDDAAERRQWAMWADSVLEQLKVVQKPFPLDAIAAAVCEVDAWREPVARARGRCWLVVGSAGVEEIEDALEQGREDVLQTEAAQEAREGLANAITFLEKAKNLAVAAGTSKSGPEMGEAQTLLVEALVTLANLTMDCDERERLYAAAQLESEGHLHLDEDMDLAD